MAKPFTNEELMDRLAFVKIPESGKVFVCDQCGAASADIKTLKHESWCPDAGVRHGN